MTHHHYNPQNIPQKNNFSTNPQPMNTKPPVQPTGSYTASGGNTQRQMPNRSNTPNRPTTQTSNNTQSRQLTKPNSHNSSRPKARPVRRPLPPQKVTDKQKTNKKLPLGKGINGLLHGILPPSVYNPNSKKIFGIFSAEDLLLVALIFLCAESDEEDNSMMILALLYILVSDYIELPDLSF